MIIARYLCREVLQTLLAVTLILLFVFSCNEFVRYLAYVANGKYPTSVLFSIVLLQMPILLGLLLPLGLYLGILLSYGRLYAENEMTVLFACGLSYRELFRMTMWTSSIIVLIVALLSMWIQPRMTLYSRQLLANAESGSLLQTVFPGRFQSFGTSNRVYYVEGVSRNRKTVSHVFVAQRMDGNASSTWGVLYAAGGHEYTSPHRDRYLVMTNGRLYKGAPGSLKFELAQYASYGIKTDAAPDMSWVTSIDTLSTWKLFWLASHNAEAMSELQWRLSAPISVIVLALVAVPLSRLKPRQGKFARILPAALLYLIYANWLFVARSWVADGKMPGWLGMWSVHLAFLFLAFLWIQFPRFLTKISR